MALVLAFDTESTGLFPKYYRPDDLNKLPHLVQLGAILFDNETWEEHGVINAIVKPDGFIIPTAASDIHGIPHEKAVEVGRSLKDVVEEFESLRGQAVGMIAHNIEYDQKLMALSLRRADIDNTSFLNMPKKCTMKAATPICNLPGKYPGSPKWPRLGECYEIFFNETLEGAHDAIVDIRGTIRVYRHLRSIKAI